MLRHHQFPQVRLLSLSNRAKRLQTYHEALHYLYQQLPMFQRVGAAAYKPSLANTEALCTYLGNPERKFPSLHIAGTNGKGSTAHTLAAIWQSAGYKVGLYTSPHLKSFTERIRINGQNIAEAEVLAFVKDIKPKIEELKPSFFELTVALAFYYFAQQQVDIAVIEVGMGGRLDSTNIITPILSLITNISFDHQKFLGDTLPKIAQEKAGIIKAKVPVVISQYQAETAPVFRQKATDCQAPIYFAPDYIEVKSRDQQKLDIYYQKEKILSNLKPDLKGTYQQLNLTGVLMACLLLQKNWQISTKAIKEGIENVVSLTQLKGRWQLLQSNPRVICDTAHNIDGIRQVLAQVAQENPQNLRLILGFTNDKNLDELLPLYPKEAFYYFCQFEGERRLDSRTLQAKAAQYQLSGNAFADVNQALAAAKQEANPQDLLLIGGSTFIVADLVEL